MGGHRRRYDGGRGVRERKEKSTYDVRLQQQVGIKKMKRRGDKQLETRVRRSRAGAGGMRWMRRVEGLVSVEQTGSENLGYGKYRNKKGQRF